MTAAEARRNSDFRRRVCDAAGAGDRALKDLLDGYAAASMTATRLRTVLAAEGVDLATIPKRTPAEVAAWKERRQPKCKACAEKEAALAEALEKSMPEGYAMGKCGCGREYPHAVQAAEDFCWKCQWKMARELAEARAEIEGLQQAAAERPAKARKG